MIHNQPYAELARIYDRVMDHVKYDAWVEYISSVFLHFGKEIHLILEIACGTGNISLFLYKYGFDVICMDLSPLMLSAGAKKFRELDIPSKFVAADMTALPLNTTFDAVLCLYDSINYLLDPADFKKALHEAARVTKSGGLFIFDVCTLKNSRNFFSDKSMTEDYGDVSYERTCRFDASKKIQVNSFVITYKGRRFVENHMQRIYSLTEIHAMISGLPFRKLGVFDDMTFQAGTENSERVHFVLQRN